MTRNVTQAQLEKLPTFSVQVRNLPSTASELISLTLNTKHVHNEISKLFQASGSENTQDPEEMKSIMVKDLVLEVNDVKRGIRRMSDVDVRLWRGRGLFGDKTSDTIDAIYLLYKEEYVSRLEIFVDPILNCEQAMALMPHELLDQCGGRDFVLISADAILQEHVLEKYADMEYHGGQFLHMAFLVEKFLLEMKKRNINYNVVFFDCDEEGMVYSDWYKKEILLPEIDETTNKNKTSFEFELHSRWVPNTPTYKLMKIVLEWHLRLLGVPVQRFTNWLDDERWNNFLRDARPSFIHGTDNTYLLMYYNFSKYDLKVTRKFSFTGNIINAFGSDIIDPKRIDRLVVEKIQGAIKSHLKKCKLDLVKKTPSRSQLLPDAGLVKKIADLTKSDENLQKDQNRVSLIALSIVTLLKNFKEGAPEFRGFSKTMIYQLSQILFASSLLQLTLPLKFRSFLLDEETEKTAKRLTEYLHIVFDSMSDILRNNVVESPLLQDLIDGRLFHKLSIHLFQNGGYSNAEVDLPLPSSVAGTFASVVKIFKEVIGSVSGDSTNEWKSTVELVESTSRSIQRDERMTPINNDLISECFGDIIKKHDIMSVSQFKSLTSYDENIEGLYDWKAAQKIDKGVDAFLLEKKKKGREEAQQRLFHYSQALQEGHIHEQRIITVTESDGTKKKGSKKADTKASVVILQRKNDLKKLKADMDKGKSDPKAFTTSNYRKLIRKCYEVWREVFELPLESAHTEIIGILNSVWELLNFFMQEVLKQTVDKIKLIPTKTDYDKWSIFHQVSFAHELAYHFQKTGESFDSGLKEKLSKKKGGKIIHKGSIIDENFYKQFKDQLVLALERAGFHRQAQLISGKGGAPKKNEVCPWTLELMFHNADDPISGFIPPKKVELGKNMLDLGFTPDDWQQDLIRYVEDNQSVLVSAPTSSGKTFIAFYAIEKVLRESNDGVVIFVCPTKALVNQVYAEVLAKYTKAYINENKHMVGMCTSDQRIFETSCQVLVTTPGTLETLMLDPTTTEWKQNLRYVILDEIHTINEQGGNNVWEHILLMINCPFLALSASLGNPEAFVDWLSKTSGHAAGGKVHLVQYKERPCPLEYSVYVPNFDKKETYIPSYAKEATRGNEVDTTKLQTVNDYMGEENLAPVEEEGEEKSGSEESGEESSEEDTESFDSDDDDDDGDDDADEADSTPTSVEAVNTSMGRLCEIHPASVLNQEYIILDEIKNMFLMSPQQCLRLYQAASRYSTTNNRPNLFVGLEPESLGKHQQNFGLLKMVSFNEYRKNIHNRLLELAEDEKNHKDLLAIFALLRAEIDEGFNQIYDNIDATQYNSEDYLFDNIIGMVKRLREEKKLPAIIFNLDHHFIDQLMELMSDYMQNQKFNLWETEEERRKNQTLIRSSCETMAGVDKKYLTALQNGIAVHYSSLPSDYQMEAERMFRMRVVPVIIATSTLALGINMPCKTVVIAGKSVYLSTTYFNQMSGRAGRRGFDSKGSVVLYGIPRASVNRFMTSPNPHILSSTGLSPSFVLKLLQLYAAQTSKEHKEIIKREILRIINTPVFTEVATISQTQIKHQILYHLDFLAKCGFLDENGEPRDFAVLASKLSTHEPKNFLSAYLIAHGLFHEDLKSERELIARKRKEQIEILTAIKKEQLQERSNLQRARKRTGPLIRKHDKALRNKQMAFEREVRDLLNQKNLDQAIQTISYLFCQPHPGSLYVGDLDDSQFFKGQEQFCEIPSEPDMKNAEKLSKIAACNILDPLAESFVEGTNKYTRMVIDTYTNFVVSYAKEHKASLVDNVLPLSKYTAYDPIAEKLRETETVQEVAEVVQEAAPVEDNDDDLKWDEDDDDLQWDEDAEEEVEEEKPTEVAAPTEKKNIEDEIIDNLEGIAKLLASYAIKAEAVSSFAALSGHNDHFENANELLYRVKHTIPLDPKEIPTYDITEHPQNAFLYDFYKRGNFEYLQDNDLVYNLNETRSDINTAARDIRGIKFALQEIAKPNAQRDDLFFLLLDRLGNELRDKISEQKQKHRFKIKTQTLVGKTDEEKFSKQSSRKDRSWGDKHAPDAQVERVRKETGRSKGMRGGGDE